MFIEEPQIDSDDWMSALLRSPIFQRLPPTNLQKILMSLEAVHYNQGESIVEQGTMGDYYYLIKSGHCELTRKPSPTAKEIKLAQMSAGDTFGEDSLLSDAPRNGSIKALTDTSLLRLNKQQFVSLIKEPSLKFVDYAEMQQAVNQGALLLDVRTPDEYESNHIEGSINEPFFSLRMQLKTLDRDKTIVVVCKDGKISEAAVFLLLRNKINAMILKGGMAAVNAKPEPAIAAPDEAVAAESKSPEAVEQPSEVKQPVQSYTVVPDEHNRLLQLEIESLKATNRQLSDKCMKLEFDKQNAEKQVRILHKQLEKLTQVLDKLQAGK
jgi:rhodanese-related sulfurtransferase/FtsZ-binding cell division protein ZapB